MPTHRFETVSYNHRLLKEIIGWDVRTWVRALPFWDRALSRLDRESKRALEIGAGNGGLSLYLALNGFEVVCSDRTNPEPLASPLHDKHKVKSRVSYASVDALQMPFPEESFDVVIFKSVLGAIGRNSEIGQAEKALRECQRILRPGGLLLFAENLSASRLHTKLRKRYTDWGESWNYLECENLERIFSDFGELQYRLTGVFALLGRTEWQRGLLARIDRILQPIVTPRMHYAAYGYARK